LNNFKYPVLRQKPIGNYIVDFYCSKLKLVIEIDGDTHFLNENKISDAKRGRILQSYGLQIVRFTNHDVMDNLEGVISVLDKIITSVSFS
ncbi:MAG TPA: endonuclease domain-containing protein, partial [Elusimicrobiales bacterium]|nr:endonuclease domain-containing protein [Elusimicrobiales bacterium]